MENILEGKGEGIPNDAKYEWYFGDDGSYASGSVVSHKFLSAGDHVVNVKATWKGGSDEAKTIFQIFSDLYKWIVC